MLRFLRTFLVALAVLGLALAEPVQATCAPPPAAAAEVSCASMAMNEDGPEQPQPMPAKACAILMCPSAPPAVAEVAKTVERIVSVAVRHVLPANLAVASANLAPEQRPPIS